MPIGIRNLQWLDHNSQRRYPLKGQITATDTTGSFTIPDDLIVSLQLAIDFALDVDPTKFFIRTIASFSTGLQITIGYDAAGGEVNVATALIAKSAHTKYQVYPLTGLGDYENCVGSIAIGSLDSTDSQPSGEFSFAYTAACLEVDTIRPSISGISSIQVQNGTELSSKLNGHIVLQAGRNARFRVVQVSGSPSRIIWDAIDGAGLTEDCVCNDELQNPIRTIQGVPGDGQANFQFLGNNCLEFEAITNGLRAKDVCSEPCCGCTELEAITQALEAFGARATTLENFLVSLEARQSTMDLVVLGSRLGDRGCTPATDCE
jgi:hypothetical protein